MGNVFSQLVVVTVSAAILVGGATHGGVTLAANFPWNNCLDCGLKGCFWCGTKELACFGADVDCTSPSSIVITPGRVAILGVLVAVLLCKAHVTRSRPPPFEPLADIQFDALEEAIELRQIATIRGNRYEDVVEERDEKETLFDRSHYTTANLINLT
ncbi:unnamed protein product [Orchesella dallaii]|uniref:PSI domain-containing protein n=1 Tax=Orchesella dallaii TaxID=48710 RepID=A0ABP1SAZ4_9HEXA